MTAPSASPAAPDTAPTTGDHRSSARWVWAAVVVLAALMAGTAIGFAGSLRSRNSAWNERDQLAREIDHIDRQLAELIRRRDAASAAVEKLNDDIPSSKSGADASTTAASACSMAADDATTLIREYADLANDARTYIDGNAPNDALFQHINDQQDALIARTQIVGGELYRCTQAVNT